VGEWHGLCLRSKGTDVPTTKCQWGSSRLTTRPRLLHTRTEPGSSGHIEWSPICQWLEQVSFFIHICDGWRRAPGKIAGRTDACPGQMPSSGPTNIISTECQSMTETANPCCRAGIEDRLANLPTFDYFSQTSILWRVRHGWPCWELELPPA